jgi:hypothetical protein
MKKIQILLISIMLILIALALFLMLTKLVQGESTREYFTYTKAICDSKNFCQDYIVVCEDKQVAEINPITGASIQQSENWQDPRANKSEISCE